MDKCLECKYELSDKLGLSYQSFVRTLRNRVTNNLKMVSGSFKEKGSSIIIGGDNFHVLVCGDAEESYKLALEYFNYTRKENEKERIFVSAKWINCSMFKRGNNNENNNY